MGERTMTVKLTTFTAALLLSSAAAHADLSIFNKPTQNLDSHAAAALLANPPPK
jgi:hypothetical protein